MRKQYNPYCKEVGAKVRLARRNAGLRQYQLAKEIGVYPKTITSIEKGKFATSIATLKQIANVLNVSVKEFV